MADYSASIITVSMSAGTFSYGRSYEGEEVTVGTPPVVITYLMAGWVSGVRVPWTSSGAPDWTGASYTGPGGPPTSIRLVAEI
jgi:hypothetical protein